MGYRSDAAIVIEFNTPENAMACFTAITALPVLEYIKQDFKVSGKKVIYHNDWIKWYDDYSDIAAIIAWKNAAHTYPGYLAMEFLRLGENDEDVEQECDGEGTQTHINYVRKLEIND